MTAYFSLKKTVNLLFNVCLSGAHSHIRGLGLDDALEPRQVRVLTWPWCSYSNAAFTCYWNDRK